MSQKRATKTILDGLQYHQMSAREQNEVRESAQAELVKILKHPVSKSVMLIGISIGGLYLSSFILKAAAKTTIGYKRLRWAMQMKPK